MVAAVELGVEGDLSNELGALHAGRHPMTDRWRKETARLERLAGPDRRATPGEIVALAYPERIARRSGTSFLLASGTRASAPAALADHEWLAVADVTRAAGAAAGGTGAMIRSAAPIDEATAVGSSHLLIDEVRSRLVDGRLQARRVSALGAIELSSTPVPASDLGPGALAAAVRAEGMGVVGWSPSASSLRRRLAFLRSRIGDPWPDVSNDALLDRVDEWLGESLTVNTSALRALVPWEVASRLDDLAPERMPVPSGSNIRLDYPEDGDGRVVCAVKLQECFGLALSPHVAGEPVQFHLLSPAGRPLAVTDDLASFWSGPYQQVRGEMRGRYPKHPWPEDPWTAPATARTTRALGR